MSTENESTGSAPKGGPKGKATVGKGRDRMTFVQRMPRREYVETIEDIREAIRAYGAPNVSNSVVVRIALEYLKDHLPGITEHGMAHLVTMAVHKSSKQTRKGYGKRSGQS